MLTNDTVLISIRNHKPPTVRLYAVLNKYVERDLYYGWDVEKRFYRLPIIGTTYEAVDALVFETNPKIAGLVTWDIHTEQTPDFIESDYTNVFKRIPVNTMHQIYRKQRQMRFSMLDGYDPYYDIIKYTEAMDMYDWEMYDYKSDTMYSPNVRKKAIVPTQSGVLPGEGKYGKSFFAKLRS